MHRKGLLISVVSLLSVMIVPFAVQAAIITACTLDEDTYHQGETGYLTVTIYNDKDNTIKITELTATVDYYYTDGTVYLQTFYSDTPLPAEIPQGQSSTFFIPFSLPTNIASGYTEAHVKAQTELWNGHLLRWSGSDHPSYQVRLYIESPYVHRYEEQLTINQNTANLMYVFGLTTLVFGAVAGFLYYALNRRARFAARPAA